MQKNAKHKRNVRNLAAVTTLTAIILIVSTYAWFIGLDEVTVNDFTVTIAATDSLELSLDGANWVDVLDIDPETIEDAYTGNTNSWTGRSDVDSDLSGVNDPIGLIPMSSIGEMDATASRMILFEKASLTPTPPYGTRLMASRVNNYQDGNTEVNGYIAFDLFVKNYTGAQYIKELDVQDEEAIYLIDESTATVGLSGDSTEDALRQAAGIENSVRIAFAQIGRVVGTEENATTITGITCTDSEAVTGICRDASIWEPNDTAHATGAINYYNANCGYRGTSTAPTGSGFTSKGCVEVANGTAYPTFAVATDISSDMNVNIYDGSLNGLTAPQVPATDPDGTAYPNAGDPTLIAVDTFTDTEKDLNDDARPSIMTLAPNSITKVRVYIYLEGQDIDNYDWAIDGKQITINFGFSKQIYEA